MGPILSQFYNDCLNEKDGGNIADKINELAEVAQIE